MAKYRDNLPQLASDKVFITDGGMETVLIFHENLELPLFASFDLLKTDEGYEALKKYYSTYGAMAVAHETGLMLDTATWRANADWGAQLGYNTDSLAEMNRKAVQLVSEIRAEFENENSPMVITGSIGPRGDGYDPKDKMTAAEAQRYHAEQVETFRDASVDMVAAYTLNYVDEAIGVTRAAQAAGVPVVIAFTLETDGRLPTGQTLKEAIEGVDAATNDGPAYFMINCAHATHFEDILEAGEPWTQRVRGVRANASRLSHAELDECETLDDGNPEEFGQDCKCLRSRLGHLNILGGCCGTDERHIEAICQSVLREKEA